MGKHEKLRTFTQINFYMAFIVNNWEANVSQP